MDPPLKDGEKNNLLRGVQTVVTLLYRNSSLKDGALLHPVKVAQQAHNEETFFLCSGLLQISLSIFVDFMTALVWRGSLKASPSLFQRDLVG